MSDQETRNYKDAFLSGLNDQLSKQSEKIDLMADSLSKLMVILARKEEKDSHIEKEIVGIKSKAETDSKRILTLEKISSGDDSMRKIFWIVVTVCSIAVTSAVLYSVVIKP